MSKSIVTASLTLAGVATLGLSVLPHDPAHAAPAEAASGGDSITLVATVRDFKAYHETGGHDDFQRYSGTTRVGLVATELSADGKPVLASQSGKKVVNEYRDSAGRNINPAMYDPALGDTEGYLENRSDARVFSESSFQSWYRDSPGTNLSKVVDLTLQRVGDSDTFVFDSRTDPYYSSRGGFFPINGELFGNYSSTGKNFHFTTEVRTEFNYQHGANYLFKFTGDDDVWVFIDGRLVVDLGSLHPIREQYLELDRLDWLVDGENYELVIFHAERRTTASNFRIETTIPLTAADLPSVTAAFD